jgi:hypothetical protein
MNQTRLIFGSRSLLLAQQSLFWRICLLWQVQAGRINFKNRFVAPARAIPDLLVADQWRSKTCAENHRQPGILRNKMSSEFHENTLRIKVNDRAIFGTSYYLFSGTIFH